MDGYIEFTLLIGASYIIFKVLTTPKVVTTKATPDNVNFWGDDNMTYLQGFHEHNKMDHLDVVHVADGVSYFTAANGLYEGNLNTTESPSCYGYNQQETISTF